MKKGFTSVLFLVAIAALIGIAGYLAFVKKVVAPTVSEEERLIASTTTTEALPEAISVGVETSTSSIALLRDCPEVWYDNRMPMVIDPGQPRPVTQYFIYKGERRELSEFDMNWVTANCQIAPSVVY